MKLALLLVALLAGCASIPRPAAEKAACAKQPCAVFTEQEILKILGKGFKDGYLKGWVDSNVQGGRTL